LSFLLSGVAPLLGTPTAIVQSESSLPSGHLVCLCCPPSFTRLARPCPKWTQLQPNSPNYHPLLPRLSPRVKHLPNYF
jgi:hypothetical protein